MHFLIPLIFAFLLHINLCYCDLVTKYFNTKIRQQTQKKAKQLKSSYVRVEVESEFIYFCEIVSYTTKL
jgi:hypothetical protein